MTILGIETSCDETSASVITANSSDQKVKVLSNVIASSLSLHSKTGGIIPEIAAREQIKYIIPVVKQSLIESNLYPLSSKINLLSSTVYRPNIDAIAVTVGPGLIGSLLVGVETAKTLSFAWNKPLIPVNHLIGHIYANFISENPKLNTKRLTLNADVEFPAIVLVVSGGHTDLLLMKDHPPAGGLKWLGGTRDDAAGEAFDKIARLINLPYPGGPAIEKAAKEGNPKAFNFPRPMIGSNDLDFSFSGLKTAVLREVKTIKQLNNETIANISASVQQAIIDVLVSKTLKTAEKYQVKSILLSGGVSANQKLRDEFKLKIENLKLKIALSVPPKNLCTDNGAMIAAAAFFNYKPVPWQKITANPELYFK
ncbi:MAG: tRNA (adenosine(37)-N6)-threonylcarbamoyltransferase complex transferase subunit TsaD [bacterium]|nr:tRNA (adenosine(37)-N6)-threonylcarbamoyltransferase complex transferase subunit TsaD [bacterium]